MAEVEEKAGGKKGRENSIGIDEIEIVARQFSLFQMEQNLNKIMKLPHMKQQH